MVHKILVVDDETSFLSGFSKALTKICGFTGQINQSATGVDAIDQISSDNYDVCFLDLNLPDISGIDVMKKIKELSPKTKVVIMTGSFLDSGMENKIARNASMFIPKPVELETIKAFLDGEMERDAGVPSDEKSESVTPQERPTGEKREHERMACSKYVTYSVRIYHNWQLHSDLTAEVINMSRGGVGLLTRSPISAGNLLIFSEGFPEKRGIVKWSTKKPPINQAGIKFV